MKCSLAWSAQAWGPVSRSSSMFCISLRTCKLLIWAPSQQVLLMYRTMSNFVPRLKLDLKPFILSICWAQMSFQAGRLLLSTIYLQLCKQWIFVVAYWIVAFLSQESTLARTNWLLTLLDSSWLLFQHIVVPVHMYITHVSCHMSINVWCFFCWNN